MSVLLNSLSGKLKIVFLAFICIGTSLPLSAIEKGPNRAPLFSRKKQVSDTPEGGTVKVKRKGFLGFLGFKKEVPAPNESNAQVKVAEPAPTPTPEQDTPKIIPAESPSPELITLPYSPPTAIPKAIPVLEDEAPRGLTVAKEKPLTNAEKEEIERLVRNAKKAIPIDDELPTPGAELPTPEETKIIEELAGQEGIGKIEFEPEDENQALSNEQLALIGAGGVAVSILLATSLQQLIKWHDQKIEEYYKSNERGKIKGEIEKLKTNLHYLREKYSWIQNKLAQMGLTMRASATGDRIVIIYKNVTGQKLAAAQLEIEKSQKDLAFRLREIAQQRAEIEHRIVQKLLPKAKEELVDFKRLQENGELEEKNLTQEQKRERDNLKHTLETARAERAKSEEQIQQAEQLLPKITPYLNGGEKPSRKEIDLYLGFGNVDANEKKIWAELQGHEKTLSQKTGALKRQEIALAALNAAEKKFPSAEGSARKRFLIQAQQKAKDLHAEVQAAQRSIEISKSQLTAYGPTNRLQRSIEQETVKSANRLSEINQVVSQIEELTSQQESARRSLAETRAQTEVNAADKSRETVAQFSSNPTDHTSNDEQAALSRLDEREKRLIQEALIREQEIKNRVSDLSESAHAKAQEDAAKALDTFISSSPLPKDAPALLLESKPELTASLTESEGSKVPEAVDFLISEFVEKKRAEITPIVNDAIAKGDSSLVDDLIKTDEKNALVVSELLAERKAELNSRKASYIPTTPENKEKSIINKFLKDLRERTTEADTKFRKEIQNGPERRIAPGHYFESYTKIALARTAEAHPVDPNLVQEALRTGQLGGEIHQLLREDPLRAASIIRQIPLNNLLTGGAMGNNKKLLNELRQTPGYNIDKILEARLKNTRLSSQIRSEIWLIESLQAVLGIPLSSNEASLYEVTNTSERKEKIEALMKQINDNPKENLNVLRFLEQTQATINTYDGELDPEENAKLKILRNALVVVKAQNKAHEIDRLKNQRRIAFESDSRTHELETKIEETRQVLADLEARHSVATDSYKKAILESQIAANRSHLATLERTLDAYTAGRMYSAEPGAHKKVNITPDQGPGSARGFRKLTGCRGRLSPT